MLDQHNQASPLQVGVNIASLPAWVWGGICVLNKSLSTGKPGTAVVTGRRQLCNYQTGEADSSNSLNACLVYNQPHPPAARLLMSQSVCLPHADQPFQPVVSVINIYIYFKVK